MNCCAGQFVIINLSCAVAIDGSKIKILKGKNLITFNI